MAIDSSSWDKRLLASRSKGGAAPAPTPVARYVDDVATAPWGLRCRYLSRGVPTVHELRVGMGKAGLTAP